MDEKLLLLGDEAIALGAIHAGLSGVYAYPGTPSTEITEYIQGNPMAAERKIHCRWSANEKTAMEAALGMSYMGKRAMVCMKHVGMNVMADPLFTISYIGTNGGLVFCVADDPGMHSSQNEQDSRHYAKASKTVMLEPSDSLECKEFTKLAYEISEKFDTPVIIRLSTRVSHSQGLVEEEERQNVELKPYNKDIRKNFMMP